MFVLNLSPAGSAGKGAALPPAGRRLKAHIQTRIYDNFVLMENKILFKKVYFTVLENRKGHIKLNIF